MLVKTNRRTSSGIISQPSQGKAPIQAFVNIPSQIAATIYIATNILCIARLLESLGQRQATPGALSGAPFFRLSSTSGSVQTSPRWRAAGIVVVLVLLFGDLAEGVYLYWLIEHRVPPASQQHK